MPVITATQEAEVERITGSRPIWAISEFRISLWDLVLKWKEKEDWGNSSMIEYFSHTHKALVSVPQCRIPLHPTKNIFVNHAGTNSSDHINTKVLRCISNKGGVCRIYIYVEFSKKWTNTGRCQVHTMFDILHDLPISSLWHFKNAKNTGIMWSVSSQNWRL